MTALELIKSNHHGTLALHLITHDPAAQRIVTAWPMLGRREIDRPLKKKETLAAATQDLWNKAIGTFTWDELAFQSDVPGTRCFAIFARLMKAGIVYPDGTISQPATDLLDGQARAHIRGLIPKRGHNARP